MTRTFVIQPTRRSLIRSAGAVAMAGLAMPAIARAAKRYSIAVVPKSLDNPVFYTAHYGAMQRAKELGDVDLIWTASATSDASQEAEIIQNLITRHVDGMAIDANAPQPLIAPINEAVDKGIVTITWDSDVPGSKREVYYGVDNTKMGARMGEQALKFMGKPAGKVILVSGGPGATNLNARLAGVKQVMGKHKGIEFLGPYFDDDDLTKGQELMNNLLTAHPDAGAIVNVAAVAFFGKVAAMPKLISNHGKVKIIGSDVLAPEIPLVQKGYVQALVGQDYWGWGYQTVSIIHNMLTNKECRYPKLVPQHMPVVTKANADHWSKLWKEAATPAGAARAFKEAPVGCMAT